MCKIPVIVYATSTEINYNVTANNVTTFSKLVNSDAVDMAYDSSAGRLYYYNSSNTLFSVKLDGSDVRTVLESDKIKRFTFDSRQKLIYYIHGPTDRIHSVNITSMQDNAVDALSPVTDANDLDMDTENG